MRFHTVSERANFMAGMVMLIGLICLPLIDSGYMPIRFYCYLLLAEVLLGLIYVWSGAKG